MTTDVKPQREPYGLELESLVKRYGAVNAVRNVDLKVRQGEFLTILGPSGSGKTTILRLIAGFVEPSEGVVRLSGRDVSRMPPAERAIGMVFQNYALFPHMTAIQNVGYGLKMRGRPRQERDERAREMLDLVGLSGMEQRYPRALSGGQQQRVALARALAFRPSLLLMDEPLGALDRELRVRMAGELRRIHAELGTTFVYVTHDREEALTLSDRIAIMLNGRIEAVDTPQNLYLSPGSSFVASFFGGHNLLPVAVKTDSLPDGGLVEVEVLGQTRPVRSGALLRAGQEAFLSIPSQAMYLEPSAHDCLSVAVTVKRALYMGELTQIECLPDAIPTCSLKVDVNGSPPELFPGAEVVLHADPQRLVAVPASSRSPS